MEDFVDNKNPSIINDVALSNLRYDYGVTSEFLAVAASYKETYTDPNIRMIYRIELPRMTNVLPAGVSDILYLKPGELAIEDMVIITLKGKEYFKINAKCVPQEDSARQEGIVDFQKKENEGLYETLGIPFEYELFKFDFSGLFAGAEVDFIAVAFDNLVGLDEKFTF